MAVNAQRQQAFAAAFNQYPDLLEQYVKRNVQLHDPVSNTLVVRNEKQDLSLMELLMAQFITRLMMTRARNSPAPLMQEFAEDTVQRYNKMTTKYIGALVMTAEDKYRRAMLHIEQGMVEVIFTALAHEAAIVVEAEKGENKDKEFSEPDFWHDIMLALGSYYRKSHHPKWWHVTQGIFLDHKKQFAEACKQEVEILEKQEVS